MKRSNAGSPHGLQADLVSLLPATICGTSFASLRVITRGEAASFAYEFMARTDALQQHPELARSVPELRNPQIREVIFRSYRIVYRIDSKRQTAEIARVWHAARGAPGV